MIPCRLFGWAGLPRSAPGDHVIDMGLQTIGRGFASAAGIETPQNGAKGLSVMDKVIHQTLPVAVAIGVGVFHLGADLHRSLPVAKEFNRGERPVNAIARGGIGGGVKIA